MLFCFFSAAGARGGTFPRWSWKTQFLFQSQSTGRVFTDFSVTGEDELNEAGTYLSVGAQAGSQVLEGSTTGYGGITAGAGIGLGDFTPSLSLDFLTGGNSYNSFGLGLGLDWDISDHWTALFSFDGENTSHIPSTSPGGGHGPGGGAANSTLIQFLGDTVEASLVWRPSETVNPFVTGRYEWAQSAGGSPSSSAPGAFSSLDSLEGGLDLNFSKHWTLEGAGQWGLENVPSGAYYSLLWGQVNSSSAGGAQTFSGYWISLSYNF